MFFTALEELSFGEKIKRQALNSTSIYYLPYSCLFYPQSNDSACKCKWFVDLIVHKFVDYTSELYHITWIFPQCKTSQLITKATDRVN